MMECEYSRRVGKNKQIPHKKITVRVKYPELADNTEALILAMKR